QIKLAQTKTDAQNGVAVDVTPGDVGSGHEIVREKANSALTFDMTSVDLTNNQIHFGTTDGLSNGDAVVYHELSGAYLPVGGLQDGHVYYVIFVNDATVKLAATKQDALAGNAITFTSPGAGLPNTQSLTPLDMSSALTFTPKT